MAKKDESNLADSSKGKTRRQHSGKSKKYGKSEKEYGPFCNHLDNKLLDSFY